MAGEGPEGGPWKTIEFSGACRGRLAVPAPLVPAFSSARLRWAPDYLLKRKPKPKGQEVAGGGLVNSQMPPAGIAGRGTCERNPGNGLFGTWHGGLFLPPGAQP